MNRTGFLMKNFKHCLDLLKNNHESIKVMGLSTHFAGAESIANHIRVGKQIKKYKKFKDQAIKAGVKIEKFHTACSAAAIRFKSTRMDMLRIGILQYGFWPNTETYIYHRSKHKLEDNPLKRVISWKSSIMTIKSVKQGEYVGYGNAYFTNEEKLIAVIPVGYGNGYSRSLSNSARVLVHGELAQVVGIVNMNAISIDITHIPNVEIGDEVVLIGKQGELEITVSSFSEFTDQLNYEVLTRLPIDLPRKIVD
jgi:alanine racemase